MPTGERRPRFAAWVGIDYSGAATADTRLPGLRACVATADGEPVEARPIDGGHWTRRMLAQWMETWIATGPPTLFGIDYGLGFPEEWWGGDDPGWDGLLDRFVARFPADQPGITVRALRAAEGEAGNARWRRACDRGAGAKSIFHFDVPGSVATSTHAGLAFIRGLRKRAGNRLHVWPFDGIDPPQGVHVLAEAWPTPFRDVLPRSDRSADLHDARCLAVALRNADRNGTLEHWLAVEEAAASNSSRGEGWILGLGEHFGVARKVDSRAFVHRL
ncbi:MAG: hypothetical protein ACKO5K_03375 [Armatimonadota bacterium]